VHALVFIMWSVREIIVVIILTVSSLLIRCTSVEESHIPNLPHRPVVLFWTDHPDQLKNISYVTPHVWHEEVKTDKDTNPFLEQAYLSSRNIFALAWRGGRTAALEMNVQELVEYWGSAFEEGFHGIAIDEFGGHDRIYIEKVSKALIELKRKNTELFVAVWHAGLLNKDWAAAYSQAADLIMLESYFAWSSFVGLRLRYNVNIARRWNIIYKSVFALGINDNDYGVKMGEKKAWANTSKSLGAQMRWIHRSAPEMPGIAFFAPRASIELLQTADSLAGEIFK
jgi:hypothetical protein